MIRIGLKLAFSGKGAWLARVITALAIGLGAALFLFALCVTPAMEARANRTAWLTATDVDPGGLAPDSAKQTTTIATGIDHVGKTRIEMVILAGNGDGAPVPAGISRLPAAGEAFVSPAAQRLMKDHPAVEQRYGRIVGTISDQALAGPDHVLVVRGVTAETAALTGQEVTGFPTKQNVPRLEGLIHLLLLIGSVSLLAPIALFVGMSTRLTAASRDERLARLRLLGASTRQVRRLAAVESLAPGIVGVLVGVFLYWFSRPVVANIDYESGRWFVHDLSPGPVGFLLVVILVPVVTVLVAQITLGAVITSPLASSARGAGRAVTFRRVLPLAVAVPALVWAVSVDNANGRNVMTAFTVLLATLVIAGPWFTRCVGALLARSRYPANLLAGRRLTVDPRAGFRSISGVILAILLSTLFVASTPSAVATLQSTKVIGQRINTVQAKVTTASSRESWMLLENLRQIEGITAATLVYTGYAASGETPAYVWLGDCTEIVAATRMSSVPCGKAPMVVAENYRAAAPNGKPINLYDLSPVRRRPADAVPDPQDVTETKLPPIKSAKMPPEIGIDMPGIIIDPSAAPSLTSKLRPSLLVFTYNGQSALEQARTQIVKAIPASTVTTRQTSYDGYNENVRRLYWALTVGTLLIFLISAVGLVIAMTVGLVERRRSFALFRASGAATSLLRRTLLVEAMAPIAVMSLLSAFLGGAIGLFISKPKGKSFDVPWLGVLFPVSVGLLVTFIVVALATTMVRRVTDSSRTRFE